MAEAERRLRWGLEREPRQGIAGKKFSSTGRETRDCPRRRLRSQARYRALPGPSAVASCLRGLSR